MGLFRKTVRLLKDKREDLDRQDGNYLVGNKDEGPPFRRSKNRFQLCVKGHAKAKEEKKWMN